MDANLPIVPSSRQQRKRLKRLKQQGVRRELTLSVEQFLLLEAMLEESEWAKADNKPMSPGHYAGIYQRGCSAKAIDGVGFKWGQHAECMAIIKILRGIGAGIRKDYQALAEAPSQPTVEAQPIELTGKATISIPSTDAIGVDAEAKTALDEMMEVMSGGAGYGIC